MHSVWRYGLWVVVGGLWACQTPTPTPTAADDADRPATTGHAPGAQPGAQPGRGQGAERGTRPDADRVAHEPLVAPGLPPPRALPETRARALPAAPRQQAMSSSTLRPFPGAAYSPDVMLQRLAKGNPRSMRPVGSTSTVFKVNLSGSVDAAFKSTTEDRPDGPASEVAAYRLSRCLGLRNVPPAISREVPLSQIEALLEPEARSQWPAIRRRLVVTEVRSVWVAAIYWVPKLQPLDIDTAPGIERWSAWLSLDGKLPATSRALAAHVSTMLLWDYLIGNYDRFSGSNAQGDASGKVIVLRDHDAAFAARLRDEVHERILRRMLRAQRFSRSFVDALRRLSPARFRAELSRDPAWVDGALVSEQAMGAVFDRRATILSHVDSLIAQHGQAAVLAFE